MFATGKGFARCLALLLALGLAACGGPGSIVVDNANIIDGTGAVWPNGRLVVVDGTVTCVGPAERCALPRGVGVLDADSFWVLPGFIDVRDAAEETSNEQVAYLAFLMGVTTAAVPEPPTGPDDDDPRPPAGSEDPRIPVPRPTTPNSPSDRTQNVIAGALAAATVPTKNDPNTNPEGGGGSDAAPLDPAERAAPDDRERQIAEWSRWAGADRRALLDSARAMGGRGLSFAPQLLELERWAAPYRLPHGMNRLLEHPLVTERIQDRLLPARTPEEAERLHAALGALREFVREFHAAGGTVATATDGALAPGLAIHEAMDALVVAGLSPEDALHSATREAATLLGLNESRGTLEPGKLADFIIVEGDPRLDVSLTQTVTRVAKSGVLYDPPTLFDALLDSPGNRVSDNPVRLVIGGGALLLTLLLVWAGIRRHRRSLGPRLV